jgi:hypothetical protein
MAAGGHRPAQGGKAQPSTCRPSRLYHPIWQECTRQSMSAVNQNRPLKVKINGFKARYFPEPRTSLLSHVTARLEGHVECPDSEPANDDIQFTR